MNSRKATKSWQSMTIVPVLSALTLAAACRPAGNEMKTDSAPADAVAASHDSTRTPPKFCGPASASNKEHPNYSGKECAGQLPGNWKTLSGNEFAGKVDGVVQSLGFGRTRPRESETGSSFGGKVLTFVGPSPDTYMLRPDKITNDVVFGVLIVSGPTGTKKFKLRPKTLSTFWMVMHPNADSTTTRWSLVHLYKNGQQWDIEVVFDDGLWKTCEKSHPPMPFSYADFDGCPPANMQSDLTPDISVSQFLAITDRIWNSQVRASATTDEEKGIWIFCNLGCCEANHLGS